MGNDERDERVERVRKALATLETELGVVPNLDTLYSLHDNDYKYIISESGRKTQVFGDSMSMTGSNLPQVFITLADTDPSTHGYHPEAVISIKVKDIWYQFNKSGKLVSTDPD